MISPLKSWPDFRLNSVTFFLARVIHLLSLFGALKGLFSGI
jgi:hypothetical protein